METCEICRSKKITSAKRCRICKNNEYYLKKGHPLTECKLCLVITRTFSNGECRSCLKNQGLRECSSCGQIDLSLVSFLDKQAICKGCRSPFGLSREERSEDKFLRRKYGITLEQRALLQIKQKSLCAICRQQRPLVIDHDHKTNKIRGLLCRNCNAGIGMLGDSHKILQSAAVYLNETLDDRLIPDRLAPEETNILNILKEELTDLQNKKALLSEEYQKQHLGHERYCTKDYTLAIAKYAIRILDARLQKKTIIHDRTLLQGVVEELESRNQGLTTTSS